MHCVKKWTLCQSLNTFGSSDTVVVASDRTATVSMGPKMTRTLACLVLVICIMAEPIYTADNPSRGKGSPAAGYDRLGGNPKQSRSVVLARHGMVATSHPLAAQTGLDVLKAGGNAADAAIAVNAMLGVVEPMSCGIGGDLFAIYWDNKTQKLYGLNASGRSPYRLTRRVFKERGMDTIPFEGPLSWSVPGCVSGWEELRCRFGSRPLSALLEPGINAWALNPQSEHTASMRW